jgi:hypothetical protein
MAPPDPPAGPGGPAAAGSPPGPPAAAAAGCGFTLDHYRELLRRALELGYRFATFAEHEAHAAAPRLFLLRHDLDFSVELAVHFARLEAALGIQATYFVRVHARHYNPFALPTYRQLREIEALGHEIGLHYEPGFAEAAEEEPAAMVRREKAVAEALLGHPIVSAAAHLPGKSGRPVTAENLAAFGLRYEAYTPRFLTGFKYLSESNGRWREGCLCGHLGRHERLCVLVHPFWWFERSPVENY